jgi:hypothetical protein
MVDDISCIHVRQRFQCGTGSRKQGKKMHAMGEERACEFIKLS